MYLSDMCVIESSGIFLLMTSISCPFCGPFFIYKTLRYVEYNLEKIAMANERNFLYLIIYLHIKKKKMKNNYRHRQITTCNKKRGNVILCKYFCMQPGHIVRDYYNQYQGTSQRQCVLRMGDSERKTGIQTHFTNTSDNTILYIDAKKYFSQTVRLILVSRFSLAHF